MSRQKSKKGLTRSDGQDGEESCTMSWRRCGGRTTVIRRFRTGFYTGRTRSGVNPLINIHNRYVMQAGGDWMSTEYVIASKRLPNCGRWGGDWRRWSLTFRQVRAQSLLPTYIVWCVRHSCPWHSCATYYPTTIFSGRSGSQIGTERMLLERRPGHRRQAPATGMQMDTLFCSCMTEHGKTKGALCVSGV